MTRLVPLRPDAFASFAEACIAHYAEDNVLAGRWQPDEATACASAQFTRLLPHGLDTPDHFIFEIVDEATQQSVGTLWFAVIGSGELRHGYVYNIRVRPEYRGRGHAKAAIERVEDVARAQGVSAIGLHVFIFNTGAQALYRSSRYGITGMNMFKQLGHESHDQ